MARSIFGGEITQLTVAKDATNADALVVAPSTAVAFYDAPGGTLVTDFLLWDGSAFTVAASSISSDANGLLPAFQGPDGVTTLYAVTGAALLARNSGGGGSWSTLSGKPAVIAAGATAAEARDAIGAGASTTLTTLEAQTGTATDARQIDAATLKAGVVAWAKGNTYTMPIWDGTGSHPLRPTFGAGQTYVVRWRQPTAPLATAGYSVAGDEWINTAP